VASSALITAWTSACVASRRLAASSDRCEQLTKATAATSAIAAVDRRTKRDTARAYRRLPAEVG
jgi:hypothetical protein